MIEIVPYDQKWPVLFDAEAARIREFMGSLALRIEHVGSTSVVVLAAKPVIDIQVSVASLETLSTHADPVQGLILLSSVSPSVLAPTLLRARLGETRMLRHAAHRSQQLGPARNRLQPGLGMSQPNVSAPPVVDQRHRARAQGAAFDVVRGVAARALQATPGQRPGPSPGTNSPLDCSCPGSAPLVS